MAKRRFYVICAGKMQEFINFDMAVKSTIDKIKESDYSDSALILEVIKDDKSMHYDVPSMYGVEHLFGSTFELTPLEM